MTLKCRMRAPVLDNEEAVQEMERQRRNGEKSMATIASR